MTPDPFPNELVEAVEEACTIIENRCGTVRGIGPAMREALAAVLPLIRSSDEPGPFEPGYADVVRRAARSADVPQGDPNPYPGPESSTTTGGGRTHHE